MLVGDMSIWIIYKCAVNANQLIIFIVRSKMLIYYPVGCAI